MLLADVNHSDVATIAPVADPRDAHDQLLYFTSSSLTSDDRTGIFIRETAGNPNLVACDFATGECRPLTQNADGYLKSYVYFDGRIGTGFGKASVSVDSRSGVIYFLQGNELRCVTLDGRTRVLATLRDDETTAFTHVSADGRQLCVPTTNARALDGEFRNNRPLYDIDERVRSEGLRSYLNIFDTTSGELLAREIVERAWITHVQFSPRDATQLLYNHEWPADGGIRRVWLWDGKTHRPLRDEGDGRSRGDWVCHEMWSRDGQWVIYHGRYAGTAPAQGASIVLGGGNGASFIGRCAPDGSQRTEIALPESFTRYGHFTVGNGDWMVTDGYYEQPDDPPGTVGAWISLLRPDWNAGTIEWRPVMRHGSSWRSQDEHPHPIFDHAGRSVYFNSDVAGRRRVYRVALRREMDS